MSRVTMIQHINLQISDKARSREWYEKVLGAEYLDRGPELNQGQLQLRIGNGEIHSTLTAIPPTRRGISPWRFTTGMR